MTDTYSVNHCTVHTAVWLNIRTPAFLCLSTRASRQETTDAVNSQHSPPDPHTLPSGVQPNVFTEGRRSKNFEEFCIQIC